MAVTLSKLHEPAAPLICENGPSLAWPLLVSTGSALQQPNAHSQHALPHSLQPHLWSVWVVMMCFLRSL